MLLVMSNSNNKPMLHTGGENKIPMPCKLAPDQLTNAAIPCHSIN